MTKPQLKKEMSVQVIQDVPHIWVYPATPDAKEWLFNNAHDFGTLSEFVIPGYWLLVVNPCYDIQEVAEYINNMGANEDMSTFGDDVE